MPAAYTEDQRDAAFFARVRMSEDPATCWEWTGANNGEPGHGRFQDMGRRVQAHRFSWEFHYGPIPEGAVVRHRCDNPPCVNPLHLLLGTQAENVMDAQRHGRFGRPAKFAEGTAVEIQRLRAKGVPMRVAAARCGVSERHAYSLIEKLNKPGVR